MAVKVTDKDKKIRILPETAEVGARIKEKIAEETVRATSAEDQLSSNLSSEIDRATEAESALSRDLASEISRATSKEDELGSALSSEIGRATTEEARLSQSIVSESDRARSVEATLQSDISAEKDRAISAEDALSDRVSEIERAVPDQVSSDNLLADRRWTQEQINQLTAYYRGSFETKALLDAWQLENPDIANNADYAYVQSDETHSGQAWRYIFVQEPGEAGSWQEQYKINDAPFTSEQLDAINSGATKTKIDSISSKLNRLTPEDSGDWVYSTYGADSEKLIKVVSDSAAPDSLVQRTGDGAIFTGSPVDDNHATPKSYVDSEVSSRYLKPDSGIPESDLSAEVGQKLNRETMSVDEGTAGSLGTARFMSAANLKQIILYHSPSGSRPPNGSAGGDLSGSYPNPSLISVTRKDTESAASLAFGDSFISLDSVTTDSKGRVTGVSKKTLTLPRIEDVGFAKQDGSYPTLGSGYFAKQFKIVMPSAYSGYVKIGTIPHSAINTWEIYNCIMLIEGLFRGSLSSSLTPMPTGKIEIEYRAYETTAGDLRIGILCGDIKSTDIFYVMEDNWDMSIYLNVTGNEAAMFMLEIISEHTTGIDNVDIFEFDGSTKIESVPEGAVYASIRNESSHAENADNSTTHVAIGIDKSADINDYYGSAYWGKAYYWGGGNNPIGTPERVNGGSMIVYRAGGSTTIQEIRTYQSTDGSNRPTTYHRGIADGTGEADAWEEFVTSDGSYKTLGAGYLTTVSSTEVDVDWSNFNVSQFDSLFGDNWNNTPNVYSCVGQPNSSVTALGFDGRYSIYMWVWVHNFATIILTDDASSRVYIYAGSLSKTSIKFNELTNATGSYDTLGAGYLSKRAFLNGHDTGAGWYKLMDFSCSSTGYDVYSCMLLVNGIYNTQNIETVEGGKAPSGLLEIDLRAGNGGANGQIAPRESCLSILAGNLHTDALALTFSGQTASLYIRHYTAIPQYQFVVLGERGEYEDSWKSSFAVDFVGADLPSGAEYATVRNIASQIGEENVGNSTTPVWLEGGVPKAIAVLNKTSLGSLGYNVTGDRSKLVTMSTLAYWDGRYQDTGNSNLTYCKNGEIIGTTGAQTISGSKTFSVAPKISASLSSTLNSTDVATTAWVRKATGNTALTAADADKLGGRPASQYVTTDTSQTISGQKTYTVFPTMLLKTTWDIDTPPSSARYARLCDWRDTNNKYIAQIECMHNTDGSRFVYFMTANEAGSGWGERLGIRVLANGTYQTYAPTPPTNDDSTQIATTKWVQARADKLKFQISQKLDRVTIQNAATTTSNYFASFRLSGDNYENSMLIIYGNEDGNDLQAVGFSSNSAHSVCIATLPVSRIGSSMLCTYIGTDGRSVQIGVRRSGSTVYLYKISNCYYINYIWAFQIYNE